MRESSSSSSSWYFCSASSQSFSLGSGCRSPRCPGVYLDDTLRALSGGGPLFVDAADPFGSQAPRPRPRPGPAAAAAGAAAAFAAQAPLGGPVGVGEGEGEGAGGSLHIGSGGV